MEIRADIRASLAAGLAGEARLVARLALGVLALLSFGAQFTDQGCQLVIRHCFRAPMLITSVVVGEGFNLLVIPSVINAGTSHDPRRSKYIDGNRTFYFVVGGNAYTGDADPNNICPSVVLVANEVSDYLPHVFDRIRKGVNDIAHF
jgi:hypothetical protein